MNNPGKFERLRNIRQKQSIARNEVSKGNKKIKKCQKNFLRILKRHNISSLKLSEQQKNIDNPNEKKFRHLLIELGIKYEYQKPFFDYERYVCVDFYIPEINTVIEIDGAYHRYSYDLKRTRYLKKAHKISQVVRFSNVMVTNNIKSVKDIIINLLM